MPGSLPDLSRAQRNPFDEFDAPQNPFDQFDGPQSSLVADLAKRTGRSMTRMPGDVVTSGGNALGAMERIMRASMMAQLGAEAIRQGREADPIADVKAAMRAPAAGDTVAAVGREMRDRPNFAGLDVAYTGELAPDPARDQQLLPMAADSVGSLASTMATPGGVIPKTIVGAMLQAGSQAEQAREFILQKGEGKEAADAEAALQFVANIPAGALESVPWGNLLGRFGGENLLKAVAKTYGDNAAKRIIRSTLEQAGMEGAEEMAQQLWGNFTAKAYNPDQKLGEGVLKSGAVGAIMGGGTGATFQSTAEALAKLEEHVAKNSRPTSAKEGAAAEAKTRTPAADAQPAPGGNDTGQNVPERAEDLRAQQEQLKRGDRPAQFFPLGTDELPLPEGMKRAQTPRGIFHYDPRQITEDEILSASANNRENEVLGLGPYNKQDVERRAAAGEPTATLVERGPNGEELRAAAVTPSTLPETQQTMQRGASADSTLQLEQMEQTLQRRQPGGALSTIIGETDAETEAQKKQQAQELQAREQRVTQVNEKREKFADFIAQATTLAQKADPETVALRDVQPLWNALNYYLRDNSTGLTREQKAQAATAVQAITPLFENARARFTAENDIRVMEQEQRLKAEREARRAADAQRMQRIDATGRDEDGNLVDLRKVPLEELQTMNPDEEGIGQSEIDDEIQRRMREEMERQLQAEDKTDDLLKVLEEVKLPWTDASLSGELDELKKEWANFGNRQKYFATGKDSLDATAEALRERGFDDIQTPNDVIEFAKRALAGEVIKPTWRRGGEQVSFARTETDGLGFYDTVLEALQTWQNKGTPDQLRAHLAKTKGTKEEAEWIGLDKFLEGKSTITKADVEDYVAQKRVKVEERVLGEDTPERQRYRELKKELEQHIEKIEQARNEGFKRFGDYRQWPRQAQDAMTALATKRYEIENDINKAAIAMQANQPVFADYTLPGGENYRELLLTLPTTTEGIDTTGWTARPVNRNRTQFRVYDRNGTLLETVDATSVNEAIEMAVESVARSDRGGSFMTGHYKQPNVLLHVRFNERKDAQGNRVLFIEEIQSDWHQKGRKRGYRDGSVQNTLRPGIKLEKATQDDLNETGVEGKVGDWIATDESGQSVTPVAYPATMTPQEVVDAIVADIADIEPEAVEDYVRQVPKGDVPDAPFKQTWPKLALKRMVRWAAENGFDRIAWTTGEQQAQRYDLSKRISEIHYSGTNLVAYGPSGNKVVNRTGVTPEDLPDLIGKDAAEKLMAQEPKGTLRTLSGVDLKLGGEGMKGFYDRTLVQIANDLAKKYGGKVERSPINAPVDQGPGAVDEGARQALRQIVEDGYGMTEEEAQAMADNGESRLVESASRILGGMENDGLSYMEARQREARYGDREQARRVINLVGEMLDDITVAFDAPTLIIPEAMKADVLQGQPLFARDQMRSPARKLTEQDLRDFEARFRRIAPALWENYRVLMGDPELLVQLGVRRDILTGKERAAYLHRRQIFWFLQQNLRADKDGLMPDRLRRDVLHETSHAWMDTLSVEDQQDLERRWKADLQAKDGWIAKARPRIMRTAGVDTDWKEYWAERLADENARWAERRESSVVKDRALVAQLAYELRVWLQEAIELLAQAFRRTKRYNVEFRRFLSNSPTPEAIGSRAPAPITAARERADFARERDSAAIEQEIRETEQRLEALKESTEPSEDVETQGRELDTRLQELRRELVEAKRQEQANALVDSGSAILGRGDDSGRAAEPAPAAAPDNSPQKPVPAARPAAPADQRSVFERIGREKRLETTVGQGGEMARIARQRDNRWKGILPTFQGGKQKMTGPVNIAIRNALSLDERQRIDTIVDYFGGGGSWGLYQALTNFPNAKRLVVHEFEAARVEKIKWMHARGNRVDEVMPALERAFNQVVEQMKADQTPSASAFSYRLRKIEGEFTDDQRGVLAAIHDYAELGRGSGRDENENETPEETLKKIIRIVSKQAKESHRGAQEFLSRGGTIDYVQGDSYAQTPLPGSNVLTIVDPPYYKTRGYQEKIVGVDTYAKTHDLLAKLAEAGNSIIYTDEAWWMKEGHEIAKNPDPAGEQVLGSIVDFFSNFDVVGKTIAGRYETLGIHHGTDQPTGIKRLAGTFAQQSGPGGQTDRRVSPAKRVADRAGPAAKRVAGKPADEAATLQLGGSAADATDIGNLTPKEALLQELADLNGRLLALESTRGSNAAKKNIFRLRSDVVQRLDADHNGWRQEQPDLARGTGTRVLKRDSATPSRPSTAAPSDALVAQLRQARIYRASTQPLLEQLDRKHPGWRETVEGLRYLADVADAKIDGLRDGDPAQLDAARAEAKAIRQKLREKTGQPEGRAIDTAPTSQSPVQDSDAPVEQEPAPGEGPMPAREFNAREESVYNEVEGHTWKEPTWLQQKWESIAKIFRMAHGTVPELPVFADDKEQRWQRFKQGVKMLRRGTPRVRREATDTIADIVKPLLAAEKLPADRYARLQQLQQLRLRLRAEEKIVPRELEQELASLRLEADKHPYGLFQSTILYLDLRWRAMNLMDDAGNPIRLTAGINLSEIEQRLQELDAKISASKHRDLIVDAIKRHKELVKQTLDELEKRDLVASDHLRNPFYFPHVVLNAEGEARGGALERVKTDTAADFRAYLQRPTGSSRPIETDYVKAMYYHLVAVGSHNLRADIVRDYWKPYDEMEVVRERAKELGQEQGRAVSWQEAYHTEWEKAGYVKWTPDDSLPLHPDLAIDRDTLARRVGKAITDGPLKPQLEQLKRQGIQITADDIREVLVADAKEVWVIPEELAKAMDGVIGRDAPDHHIIERLAARPLELLNSSWKVTKLYAPWNYPRYEFNNTIADIEKLFSADPKVFSYLSGAAKEVREFIEKGKGTREVREAFKRGVLDSITAAELGDLAALREFEALQTGRQKLTREILRRITTLGLAGNRSTVDVSRLREATFRFAKFKADVERIRAGARPVYAGAYWRDVEAITDTAPGTGDAAYNKAAEISLATFGDYQNITPLGGMLRRYLVPFYSWQEINFRYHANLFRNLKDMIAAREMANAEALAAGGRMALAATSLTTRVAAGVLVRLALPYVITTLWNNLMFPDLEDGLSEEDKRRFHIILGRDDDGKTMIIYGQLALADVMRWVSGQEAGRQLVDIALGHQTFLQGVSEWLERIPRDFANNTVQFLGPTMRAAYTAGSRKDVFPDVTDQRTISNQDVGWVILSQMTDMLPAELLRRAVDKDYVSPRDFGEWAQQAVLQIRRRDPEQWAYFSLRDKAADYVWKTEGRRDGAPGESRDLQLLRNFRRAIYKGDVAQAMRAYDRLLEVGYNAERLRSSIQAQEPLADIPKARRRDFVDQLSKLERWQLEQAYRYYVRMAELRGAERSLFPRKEDSETRKANFAPRYERLRTEIERADRLTDEEAATRAEAELRRSLRPASR